MYILAACNNNSIFKPKHPPAVVPVVYYQVLYSTKKTDERYKIVFVCAGVFLCCVD